MSDKISISMDEVNRATPVPGTSAPAAFPDPYAPAPGAQKEPNRRRTGLFVTLGVLAAIMACCIAAAIVFGDGNGQGSTRPPVGQRQRTVDDVRQEILRELEAELSSPSSQLRKRIEDAHLTVTVTSTRVVRIDIATVDGSNQAGPDNSNIAAVSMLIRFNWEGVFDSGYTDLRIIIDAINDRTEAGIEYTTALVNTEDPDFWYGIGSIIGAGLL